MASQWYFRHGGIQKGPVSSAVLRQLAATGQLLPTDLVWKQGLADWIPAEQIKDLFDGQPPMGGPPPAGFGSWPHVSTPNLGSPQSQPQTSDFPDGQADNLSQPSQTSISQRGLPLGIVLTAFYSGLGAFSCFFASFILTFTIALGEEITNKFRFGGNRDLEAKVIFFALGFFVIVLELSGLFYAAVCYGLFTRQKWAFTLTRIVYGVSAGLGLLAFLFSIVLASPGMAVLEFGSMVISILVFCYFQLLEN